MGKKSKKKAPKVTSPKKNAPMPSVDDELSSDDSFCHRDTWKAIVKCKDVEILDVGDEKIGKKMRLKKSGVVLHYNENLWSGKYMDHPPNVHMIGPFPEKTQIVMENDDGSIFLRYFDDRRVFMKEAAEAMLRVNSSPPKPSFKPKEFEETINELLCTTSQTNLKVLSMDHLDVIFEKIGLDKSSVTLIPDIMFADNELKKRDTQLGLISYLIPGPYCQPVYSMASTICRIFREIICHVDWSKPEELKELIEAVKERTKFMLFMSRIEQPETYLRWDVVGCTVHELSCNPIFQARKGKNESEMRKVLKCKSDESFFTDSLGFGVPARMAFTFLMEEWVDDVLGNCDLAKSIHAEVETLQDHKQLMNTMGEMIIVPRSESDSEQCDCSDISTIASDEEEWDFEDTKKVWKEMIDEMETETKNKMREMAKENEAMKETIEDLKRDTEQLKVDLQKPCQKCYRTHQHCEEAKANLKSSESKVKKLENKLEISEKVIKEYKKKETKIREKVENEWKERFQAMEKKLKDEKEMKSKMQAITKENKAIKDSNEELKREKEQLKGDKDQLQAILEQKEQEISELREQGQKAMSDARFKDRRIEDLTKTYSRLIKENQKLKKTPLSSSEDPPSSQSSSSLPESSPDASSGATDPLKQLFINMVDIKNRHLQEQRGLQATEKVQKLKRLSEDPRVLRHADLELKRYNLEYKKFMDSLTKNINNLQSLMKFVELPDAPELSKEFMEGYNEAIALELLKKLGPDEISDPECLICTDNMTELKGTLKCTKCLRRYHVPCVGKWLTEHIGCPVCKMNMRNLEQYPELAPYRS